MKRDDIKPCILCGEGVLHDNNLTFYRIKLTRMIVDVGAVNRQAGLEMMVGSPAIANIMGPDEDLAQPIMEEIDVLVCEPCAYSPNLLAQIMEKVPEEEETPDEAEG